MALARIRTHFPEEVGELCDALVEAGYTVETIRPDEYRIAPADLELTVDKIPVVEAWRHVPNAENVYVAPGTPQSGDIRSSLGAQISREPLVARMLIGIGESSSDLSRWMKQQSREIRAWMHSLRERQWTQPRKSMEWTRVQLGALRAWSLQMRDRWTPPREYSSSVHLEPNVAANENKERIDHAIEQARRHAEELRLKKEAEELRLQEQARLAEENRRRAREAAEARAMLEQQQKIEAMVRASESLREQVVAGGPPKPRLVERRRPRTKMRFLPRTRREHAYFRAGIAAFTLSLVLAIIAAQALHPHPASGAIPLAKAAATSTASQPAPSPSIAITKPAATTTVDDNASLKAAAAAATMDATSASTVSTKPSALRPAVRRANEENMIADDEVVVHKTVARRTVAKPKPGIVHYSDLN